MMRRRRRPSGSYATAVASATSAADSDVSGNARAMLSHEDLLVLKSKIEQLRAGAKFHYRQAEWTLGLTQPPSRAQEAAISVLSGAILVFALLLNSVAGPAFSPLLNPENSHTAFAFNLLLGLVFTVGALSTLFLTYITVCLAMDNELGAWRSILRFERLVEPFLWFTAIAQFMCIAMGILASAYTAEQYETKQNAENLAGGAQDDSAACARTWSWITIGGMLFVMYAKYIHFYVWSTQIMPMQMRHWAIWLAPFALYMFPSNARDCARMGPLYARMIVKNVATFYGWRLFPYDAFYWPEVGYFSASSAEEKPTEVSSAEFELWRRWLREQGSTVFHVDGKENHAHALLHEDDGAPCFWYMPTEHFVDKHQIDLIAVALTDNDIRAGDLAGLDTTCCLRMIEEVIPRNLASIGQKVKLARILGCI
ncbi:unnamed protein product [Amoebophrya sp. A25]|nr:unnamed protein product [Amoebophrya sp. A25]|eukprot:GSA25T00021650001.1